MDSPNERRQINPRNLTAKQRHDLVLAFSRRRDEAKKLWEWLVSAGFYETDIAVMAARSLYFTAHAGLCYVGNSGAELPMSMQVDTTDAGSPPES